MTTLNIQWASDLFNKIQLVCPVQSIKFVDKYVKFTWEIIYQDNATEKQKKLAEDIINNFDVSEIDRPIKSEIDILKERIVALEAKTVTTGIQK